MSDPTKTQEGGKHYLSMRIQPERFIYENAIGFHEGNVIKYVCRHKSKGGVTDLRKARHYLDLLIAHYENDERFGQPEPDQWTVNICGQNVSVPVTACSSPPPAPDLPRLNAGWKWADTRHVVTQYDLMYSKLSQRQFCGVSGWMIGQQWQSFQTLATPDWHNPENIESPGEGYRFLVKGETILSSDEYWGATQPQWYPANCINRSPLSYITYRTPATRPLPPVLAQDKEAQP